MKDRIYLGKDLHNESIYLYKHNWDCGWYWGMGYLGNNNNHYHFKSYLDDTLYYSVYKVFSKTWLSQDQWHVLLDLFKQAYSLKAVAKTYRYGGRVATLKGITDILINKTKEDAINKDLELLLDTLWRYLLDESAKAE
jgi:hypothetical protein